MSSESLKTLWCERLQQWQESGLTQTFWCQQNSLNSLQLSYWKRKFRDQSIPGKLVPLSVTPEPGRLTTATVSLPSGIRLEVQTANITGLVRGPLIIRPAKDVEVFLYADPVGMRKSIDGLACLIEQETDYCCGTSCWKHRWFIAMRP